MVSTMTWLTVLEYLSKWQRICSTGRKHFPVLSSFMTYHRFYCTGPFLIHDLSPGLLYRSFPRSWLITGFVTRLTRRVPLVEHALLTLPVLSGDSCYSIFSFMCRFCRSLFVLLYFFFWSLFCLFFFDIQILITTLVSSQSSYTSNLPWQAEWMNTSFTFCMKI